MSNVEKLVNQLTKHFNYNEGTVYTNKNGVKYRYDTWVLKYPHTEKWLENLFKRAVNDVLGKDFLTEFTWNDYSFNFQRSKFKSEKNGRIFVSKLIKNI